MLTRCYLSLLVQTAAIPNLIMQFDRVRQGDNQLLDGAGIAAGLLYPSMEPWTQVTKCWEQLQAEREVVAALQQPVA